MELSKASPTWWLCGIAYPCFAMMTLTPALPSMGASAINKKTTTAAAVFGVIFFHAAIAIFVVMIILAIYTTACPMMWGFCRKITTNEKSAKYRIAIIALTVLGMIGTRLFRLGDLINVIYSISGYVGAVVLVGILISNIIRKNKAKSAAAE